MKVTIDKQLKYPKSLINYIFTREGHIDPARIDYDLGIIIFHSGSIQYTSYSHYKNIHYEI